MVGGAIVLAAGAAGAAIKLSSDDAQRIEEHTGIPPSELEDDDLNEAMNELGIQGQELTAEDQAALSGDAPVAAPTPAAPPAPAAGGPSYVNELEQLADLRDRGIITAEDFEAKKKELLGL